MSQSLSARRGSMSAPDPFGEHAHLRRPSSSTLTIVRIPATPTLHEPQKLPARRFALSSFTPRQDQHISPSTSPSSSPRLRPRRFSQGIAGKPRLSAEQVIELARQAKAAPGSSPQSPVLSHRPHSPHTHSPTPSITQSAPATFTPLPDDIYLPFIYRTEEVSQLISTPPTAKLFSLLKQAFSTKSDDDRITPPGDPAQWSYSHLLHHLTNVDRDACPDADWVFAARKCIMSHSELIWERVKSALGVPPELDIENPEEFLTAFESDESAIDDSPLVGRVDHFPAALARHFSSSPDDTSDSAPADVGSLLGYDELEDDHLTFEPLLSTSAPNPTPLSLPPTSLGGSAGLGDIAEGAEEEGEEEIPEGYKPLEEEDDLISPSQIQGLRISTGCKSPNESVINSPVVNTPASSSFRPSAVRSSSFNDVSSLSARISMQGEDIQTIKGAGISRAQSTGRSYSRSRPVSMSALDPKEWDVPYNPVGDRGPGNPLFPSNFSRLALGPTLRANNPSLRAPGIPPASRYGHKPRSHSGTEYALTTSSGD